MKRFISLFMALIMIIAAVPAIITSVSAAAPTPLYNFNFEADNAKQYLINTHLNAAYDKTESALRFVNNKDVQQDQGITPNSAADKEGETANTDIRKNAAEQLKKTRYVVITYRNRSDISLGSIRTNINGRDYNRLYNMKTNMESYEDVIVPTPDGAVYRDGGAPNQAPFCMYLFASVGANKLKVGLAQMLYVKNIAFFEKYEDAEAYAKANVESAKTTGYTYADPDKVDTGIDAAAENISGLLADAVAGNNVGGEQSGNANPSLEEKLFDSGADIIEWHFNNTDQVTKHTTNTNHYNAVYDKELNAMVFTPRKTGNAGDQGIVAAKGASEADVKLREDFVKNASANYKYMVLTYLNNSDVNNMTFRYLDPKGFDARTQIKIKTAGECAGNWQRVVIDAANGLVLRDSTAVSTSNMCFFPLTGQVTEKDSIAWKTLAFFKTKEAAEAYAAELTGPEEKENESVEEVLFGSGEDIIEWHFNNSAQVSKHTTNTNNYTAVYDRALNAMVFAPKKAGNAGDQGIVAAHSSSDDDVKLREDFVKNAPGNYKYMVLTYLNRSNVDSMVFRYMKPDENDARFTIKIKTEEECADKWQRVVIDATNGLVFRSSTEVYKSNMCFFPLSGQVLEGDSIAWKTLAFFKTKEAAEAYAAEEVAEEQPEETSDGERIDNPFIAGYEGRTFKPDGKMTRAEAVTVVTRLLVDETTIKGKNTSAFADVKS
ncbi:MAG: S-layer homology domain-containing protein, partial [Clostridia bacterium]|nr:S-layer homology domain-containing protein [Clostridia bacterium]